MERNGCDEISWLLLRFMGFQFMGLKKKEGR
jgi:hypothetical protein